MVEKLKKYIKNVSVRSSTFHKQIFKIGFSSDGGYWIQDLVRYGQGNRRCGVLRIPINVQNHGIANRTPTEQGFTTGELKYSHHFDGSAQISGDGVLSGWYNGNYPNGKKSPKGIGIRSFPLTTRNDGGPAFGFMFWGGENLMREGGTDDITLKVDKNRSMPGDPENHSPAIAIEGFYVLKKSLPDNCDYTLPYHYRDRIGGVADLMLVPTPSFTPGVLGFVASETTHGFNSSVGFTMNGAPSRVYAGLFFENISAIYPWDFPPEFLDRDLDYGHAKYF